MALLLHDLLERAARDRPEAIAVVDRDRSITYAELDRRANQIAHLLAAHGVTRGDRVALYLDKSIEAVAAVYGVLKAGAAYVPLDPAAPVARLGYIAGNCSVTAVLSAVEKQESWAPLREAGAGDAAVLPLTGGRDFGDAAGQPESPPAVPAIDLDLAYILYTSGSTGDPKGVKLSHLNALTFVRWVVDEFAIGPDDRLSSHAPFHFDLSILDLYAASMAGATLVLVPPRTSVFPNEVAKFIAGNEITVWYSVPSILTMLTLRGGLKGGEFPALRTMFFAGEVFPTKYLRTLMRLLPHVRFVNLYGPTETNVCTWYDVPPLPDDDDRDIPIGRAIAGVEVFPVTDHGTVAAPGEVGELHVRGTTVMQGYWGDPERTAKVLFPNPFDPEVHDPVYRTGDLVQDDGSGDFRFLGRRDAQIKSRGYRIELGEIESALNAHPGVVECAAVAVPDDMITNRIKAFVVVRDGTTEQDLIRFCGDRIPKYMVPDSWAFLAELGKTSTGKIDRQALRSQV